MEEEEGGAVEEQEGGETEASDAPPEGGNGNQTGSHGGRTRKDPFRPLRFQTYKEAASKYYLHHTDNNMVGAARPGLITCSASLKLSVQWRQKLF